MINFWQTQVLEWIEERDGKIGIIGISGGVGVLQLSQSGTIVEGNPTQHQS